MRVSDQLIEQVLAGNGSTEERDQVMEFLRRHPGKLRQFLTEDSWNEFDANAVQEGNLPPGKLNIPTAAMRSAIENAVGKPVGRVLWFGYGWVAAASVVVIVCSLYLLQHRETDRQAYKPESAPLAATTTQQRRPHTVSNSSRNILPYTLPDGTTVKLGSNSAMTFNDPFIDHRRDIILSGEAVFSVAKDKTRPFAVHSKGFVTTALGTVFKVNSRNSQTTVVHLYSGRVLVSVDTTGAGRKFQDIYLAPGQQLLLNNNDFTAALSSPPSKPTSGKFDGMDSEKGEIKFVKKPLAEIFHMIEQEYGVTISYRAGEIKNMDFTGTFNTQRETLQSFLSTLCDLNELTFRKTDDKRFSVRGN